MVFTLSDDGVVAIPGGFLVTRVADLPSMPHAHLKEQWARTRPKHIHRMAMSKTGAPVAPAGEVFPGIREALATMVAAMDAPRDAGGASAGTAALATSQSGPAPVWELQFPAGQIRRGSVTRVLRGKEPGEPLGFESPPAAIRRGVAEGAADQKRGSPVAPAPQPAAESVAERPRSQRRGLRLHAFESLDLPSVELANPVAAYLGGPVAHQIGWLTVAPTTGSTLNWNGTSVRTLTWSGHATTFADSAKAALLEGMERRVGALQSDERFVVAARSELSGRVLTPEDFPPYGDEFYEHRGARYDPAETHEWVSASSLVTGEDVWIPREFVYYGQQMAHRRWALSTSSGCATGSTLEEAVLFGLLELIERDAFVASWYGRIPPTRISPSSVPGLTGILTRAELLGYSVECGFVPSETGIPVAVASIAGASQIGHAAAVGASCHPSARQAIAGAVKEAWTYICERIALAPEMAGRIEQLAANPTLCEGIGDHPLLCIGAKLADYRHPCGTEPAREFSDDNEWEPYALADPRILLERLADDLWEAGIEVFSHIQTSDIEGRCGLETVMVIAPSLLPIDFGWENQRALRSPRLHELMRRHHGTAVQPRDIPHPFS